MRSTSSTTTPNAMITVLLVPLFDPLLAMRRQPKQTEFNTARAAAESAAHSQRGVCGETTNSEMMIHINPPPFTNTIFFHVLIGCPF